MAKITIEMTAPDGTEHKAVFNVLAGSIKLGTEPFYSFQMARDLGVKFNRNPKVTIEANLTTQDEVDRLERALLNLNIPEPEAKPIPKQTPDEYRG